MDDFDQLIAAESWDRPLDTHDAVHLLAGCLMMSEMLSAREVRQAMRAEDAEYAEVLDDPLPDKSSDAALAAAADKMGEVGRRFASRLGEWVDGHGIGPLYLYVPTPCCGEMLTMVVGGGPARFYDPELDVAPGEAGADG